MVILTIFIFTIVFVIGSLMVLSSDTKNLRDSGSILMLLMAILIALMAIYHPDSLDAFDNIELFKYTQ